jgi:hypothetical protein
VLLDLGFTEVAGHGHREGDHQTRITGDQSAVLDGLRDAGGVVPFHRLRAVAAVERRRARQQQLQVIVQFRHRADSRARAAHRIGLVDGNGGRHAVDAIDLRLVHPVEELTGVGRERLDIAPLSLCIEGVEHQRGLAAAGHAGDHHQLAGGYVQVEILEVVLAGPADADRRLPVPGLVLRYIVRFVQLLVPVA